MHLPAQLKKLLKQRLFLTATKEIESSELSVNHMDDGVTMMFKVNPNHFNVFLDNEAKKFNSSFARFLVEGGFKTKFTGSLGKYFSLMKSGLVELSVLIEASPLADISSIHIKSFIAFDEDYWFNEITVKKEWLIDNDLSYERAQMILENYPELSPKESASVYLISEYVKTLKEVVYRSLELPKVIFTRPDFEDHVVTKHNVSLSEVYEAYLNQTAEPCEDPRAEHTDGLGREKKKFLGIANSTQRLIQPIMTLKTGEGSQILVTAWDLLERDENNKGTALYFWMKDDKKRWRLSDGDRYGLYVKAEKLSGKKWDIK